MPIDPILAFALTTSAWVALIFGDYYFGKRDRRRAAGLASARDPGSGVPR